VRLHIPSLIGLPSPWGGGVNGGVIGLARPLDELRPTLPLSSISDISSDPLASNHESRCDWSSVIVTDWERSPPTDRAALDGGKVLRFCWDVGYGMAMGCDVDETDVPGDWISAEDDREDVPLDDEFARLILCLFHGPRLDELSERLAFEAFVFSSQCWINEDNTLSRIKL
jgi:hypothetical protein